MYTVCLEECYWIWLNKYGISLKFEINFTISTSGEAENTCLCEALKNHLKCEKSYSQNLVFSLETVSRESRFLRGYFQFFLSWHLSLLSLCSYFGILRLEFILSSPFPLCKIFCSKLGNRVVFLWLGFMKVSFSRV